MMIDNELCECLINIEEVFKIVFKSRSNDKIKLLMLNNLITFTNLKLLTINTKYFEKYVCQKSDT